MSELTAEQVREAWCSNLKRDCLYDPPSPDWQAIADELNTALGGGECENVSDPSEGFLCSACGWGDFAEPSHLLTTAKFTGNEHGPNFCPNCGKAVKR